MIAFLMAVQGCSADEAVRVIDGDGIELNGVDYRLWGVDAPEKAQECERGGLPYPCGQDAKDALTALVKGKAVICETLYLDRYKRPVARCEADGLDLGSAMVRQGWAIDYRRFSKGYYAADQAEAKTARRGLWDGTFQMPVEWRKLHR